MEHTKRLREAKLAEQDLVSQGKMYPRPYEEEIAEIRAEIWDRFEDEIFMLVRRERIVQLGYPIIYFRSFAYYAGNTSRSGERAVAIEYKDEDEKKPIIVRFSTELNRCGLLDDAHRLPDSYQKMIRAAFELWTIYHREIARLEEACALIMEKKCPTSAK